MFLDYNMPGLNGVETLAEIKRQSPQPAGRDHDLDGGRRGRGAGAAAGAAAFLKKPFYPADIDAVLHRIFGLQMRARRA